MYTPCFWCEAASRFISIKGRDLLPPIGNPVKYAFLESPTPTTPSKSPQPRSTDLVVTWNGDIHISEGRVGVAESNGGDVDIGRLSQRLVISTGVRDDQKPGLPEGSLDLIGEGTRSEATSKGGGAGGRGELQHCPLQKSEKKTQDLKYRQK